MYSYRQVYCYSATCRNRIEHKRCNCNTNTQALPLRKQVLTKQAYHRFSTV